MNSVLDISKTSLVQVFKLLKMKANFSSKSAALMDIKNHCQDQIYAITISRIRSIGENALKSDIEYIRWLGEALLHYKCEIKPTTEELGYSLAKIEPPVDIKSNKLYIQITEYLDISSYIFNNTHYDTSISEGRYYKMS